MRIKAICMTGIMFLISAMVFAQTTLDNFETAFSGWSSHAGWSTPSWNETDGANGTAKSMDMDDAGWSAGITKTFTGVVPENGNYKVTFFYKNGIDEQPIQNLLVKLNGANTINLGSSQVTTWTAAETGVAMGLTAGGDILIEIEGNTPATQNVDARFDEFVLVKVTAVPITVTVRPLDGYYVAGTQVITAEAVGGSGSYTKAEFDIGNDASIDHTDSTPGDGFSYSWDTTAHPDGSIAVKVTITDSSAATGESTVNYTIDNANGRESLVLNGGFESWSGTYPDEWTFFNSDPDGIPNPGTNAVVSKETASVIEGNNALKIEFPASDTTYRYTMLSNSFPGTGLNYILWYWGKGGSDIRMYYFESLDGAAWTTSFHGLFSDSSATAWNEAMDSAWTPGAASPFLAVATHKYSSTNPGFWDDVRVTTSIPISLSVNYHWDLYY